MIRPVHNSQHVLSERADIRQQHFKCQKCKFACSQLGDMQVFFKVRAHYFDRCALYDMTLLLYVCALDRYVTDMCYLLCLHPCGL